MQIIKKTIKPPKLFVGVRFRFSDSGKKIIEKYLGVSEETQKFIFDIEGCIHFRQNSESSPYNKYIKEQTPLHDQINDIKILAEKLTRKLDNLSEDAKECIAVGYKRGHLGLGGDDREDVYLKYITNEVQELEKSCEMILDDTKHPEKRIPDQESQEVIFNVHRALEKYFPPNKIKFSSGSNSKLPKIIKVIFEESGFIQTKDITNSINKYKVTNGL